MRVLALSAVAGLWLAPGSAAWCAQAAPRKDAPRASAPAKASAPADKASRPAVGALAVADLQASPQWPGLGRELTRATAAALQSAGLELAKGPADPDHTVTGRVEISGEQARLFLRLRGLSVEAVGDLEHLDVLARDGANLLKDLLQPPAEEPPGKPPRVATASPPGPGPGKDPRPPGPVKPPDKPVKPPDKPVKPPEKAPDKPRPPDKPPERPPERPPEKPDMATPEPRETPPPPQPVHVPARVAVHIVAPPPRGSAPLEFYTVGYASQQAVMNFLHNRLRVQVVPSDLQGLSAGMEAQNHSLRRGATWTLMARFDRIVLHSSQPPLGYGAPALTLQGTLHVVLLHGAYPSLDRSISIPPFTFVSSDAPETVAARALSAALEQLHGDLATRLAEAR